MGHIRETVESDLTAVEKHDSATVGPIWRAWSRRSIPVLVTLMFVYVGVCLWVMRRNLADSVGELPFSALPPVIGLVILGLVLRAIRWHYYVWSLGWRVPFRHSAVAFLASVAFTATPGKAGEAIKSVLLRMRYDVPISAGFGVLVVERLGDLIAVLVLSVTGVGLVTGATKYLTVAAIVVGIGTVVASNNRAHRPLLARLARVRRLRSVLGWVAGSLDACRQLLKPTRFMTGATIAIVAWGCEAAAFWYLARKFGIDIRLMDAAFIYGAATLAGVLSALPGGLGGFEVVMVVLLNQLGVSVAAATLPVAIFRLCTLWFGIMLGAIFMVVWILFVGAGNRYAHPKSSEA